MASKKRETEGLNYHWQKKARIVAKRHDLHPEITKYPGKLMVTMPVLILNLLLNE